MRRTFRPTFTRNGRKSKEIDSV